MFLRNRKNFSKDLKQNLSDAEVSSNTHRWAVKTPFLRKGTVDANLHKK